MQFGSNCSFILLYSSHGNNFKTKASSFSLCFCLYGHVCCVVFSILYGIANLKELYLIDLNKYLHKNSQKYTVTQIPLRITCSRKMFDIKGL